MAKAGRPLDTGFIATAPKKIRAIAERDLPYKHVADILGVPVRRFRRMIDASPEIKAALDEIGAWNNGVGEPAAVPYKPEFCGLVIAMGKEGKSRVEMAAAIGVAKNTIEGWADDYDDFAEAYEMALTHSQAWWEKRGREGLTEVAFNGNLWARNIGPRFRDDWSESKVTLTHEAGDGISNLLEQLNGRSRGLPAKDK